MACAASVPTAELIYEKPKIKSREKGKNFMRWFTSDKRVLEMPDVVHERKKWTFKSLYSGSLNSTVMFAPSRPGFNRVFSDDNSYLKDLVSSDNYKDTN